MTEKSWRGLMEVTQPRGVASEQALLEHLSMAVVELNMPPAFLERLQSGVAEAIRRAWQHDQDGMTCVTVAALVQEVGDGQLAQCWGFFLIEKRLAQTADRRIEVLLYPEL
jgi:hypothetical protein